MQITYIDTRSSDVYVPIKFADDEFTGVAYLAAPYTHKDPAIVDQRMKDLCKADAALMKRGIFTMSPLLKHYIVAHESLPTDFKFWEQYSKALMRRCDYLFVLMLDGWSKSEGVLAEIDDARRLGMPIYYIEP